MRKKLLGKIEYAPELIGHFEVIGDLTLTKRVREGVPCERDPNVRIKQRSTAKLRPKRATYVRDRIEVARLHLHPSFSFWNTKFNVPPEIADKMRLGKRYKIQCTILEVKDDAES